LVGYWLFLSPVPGAGELGGAPDVRSYAVNPVAHTMAATFETGIHIWTIN